MQDTRVRTQVDQLHFLMYFERVCCVLHFFSQPIWNVGGGCKVKMLYNPFPDRNAFDQRLCEKIDQ